MRKAVTALAVLLSLAVVVQFFLAGSGAFSSAPNDESFQPHRVFAVGILALAVVLTVLAAVARMPGRLTALAGLVVGLTLLQSVIRAIADAVGGAGEVTNTASQLVFGLHGVNGLVIMGLAGTIVRLARAQSSSTGREGRAGGGSDAGVSGPTTEPAQPSP